MESLFLEPITFSEAKSTDTRALGSWTDGRNFEKPVFRNPLPRVKSSRKGVAKNTRAFRLVRTEPIPVPQFAKGRMTETNDDYKKG